MKKSEIVKIGLILFVVVFLGVYGSQIERCTHKNARKSLQRDIEYITVRGIVSERFFDNQGHMIETLVVNNHGQSIVMVFPHDKSGLFEYVQINDSIFKEKGSMRCLVVRDTIDRIFVVDFSY